MSTRRSGPDDVLATRTRQAAPIAAEGANARVFALTVLAHADARRIGERASLFDLMAGEPVPISRLAPTFAPPAGGPPGPLADPFLSRDALASIVRRDAGVHIRRGRADASVRVDGKDLAAGRAIADEELERGVVLEVGERCALLLHSIDAVQGKKAPAFDLVGESDAIRRLRRDIARVAATDMRVLIRGATGSGKEVAARAIHQASGRAGGPYEAVNMGAIPPSLSASALFGHVRGSFSGAVADHDGHFLAAHGGTLFLDEIGDTEPSVQAMLLRTLETSEVQRVGDRRARKVDVRLLSATDADLELAVAEGRFREPLLHRIGEVTLRVPSLAERRDDLGRLIVHFLREQLDASDQARLLDGGLADRPWLASGVVARLARAPWTGNVRQLRNVVRQLVVLGREEATLSIGPEIEALLGDTRRAAEPRVPLERDGGAPRVVKKPQELTEDEILSALEKTGWRRAKAADLLGIARSSLYALIAGNKRISRSFDLTRADVEAALAQSDGDVTRAARALSVSEHGLKLRMQSLGVIAER